MPKYLVETVSMFRMRYVVDCKEATHATDTVVVDMGTDKLKEFSQEHLDEIITSVREISKEEYLRQFDEDNDYLKDWTEEQKLQFITKVDYNDL